MKGRKPPLLTDDQLAIARELYEGGEVTITEIAKISGIYYLRLVSMADKLGWVRKSSVTEINRAREMAGRGLHRKAIEYLCSLIPTQSMRRDEEIIAETRRLHLVVSRRAVIAAREAVRE